MSPNSSEIDEANNLIKRKSAALKTILEDKDKPKPKDKGKGKYITTTTASSQHQHHNEEEESAESSDSDDEEPTGPEEDHEEVILQLSIKQMYRDTLNLDWSKVLWDMVFALVFFHLCTLLGFYYAFTFKMKWQTYPYVYLVSYMAGMGITMGTHRMWTHKAFKAHFVVRVSLMLMNCLAFQESIFIWCQNHRVHHKWSDTDKDFTNSRRGFFFAHMGWKMYQTHPDVIEARKKIDVSDLLADPIVNFQHYYYYWVALPVCFLIPTVIPWYFWGEDLWRSFFVCAIARLAIVIHGTWCINSVAHLYGYKPYDTEIHAFEHNILGPIALGEGWHNYHHVFPRDYRASEKGHPFANITTFAIETLSKVGLCYDLRVPDKKLMNKRVARTGNGTRTF